MKSVHKDSLITRVRTEGETISALELQVLSENRDKKDRQPEQGRPNLPSFLLAAMNEKLAASKPLDSVKPSITVFFHLLI